MNDHQEDVVMIAFVVVAIVMILLACTGCEESFAGTIVRKTHFPSWTSYEWDSKHKHMNAIHHPDRWLVSVVSDDGNKERVFYYNSREEWEQVKPGYPWENTQPMKAEK